MTTQDVLKIIEQVNSGEAIKALGKKNVVMDATLLSSLMSCPRLFDLRFNHNFQSLNGKSNSLEVGSIVHKVLEVYYQNRINQFSRSMSIAAGIAAGETYIRGCNHCTDFLPSESTTKPICGHRPNDYPGVKNTPMESDGRKAVGWKWALETCEQYFERWKNDFWVPLEVEVVKGRVLYEDDEIRVLWKAKLDLIVDTNQAILPTDHKTSKQRRNTLFLNNQFIGQCIIMETRNVVINKIGFQTSLKPEEKFTRELGNYSIDRLLEWQSEILPLYAYRLIEYTEAEYWPPNFTHCETKYGNCTFVPVCEADRNMREQEIKMHFYVGPTWNPTNEEDNED